jgi:uncharacterized membrane protein YgcG
MQRFLLAGIIVLLSALLPITARASDGEQIDRYVTQMIVHQSGELEVLESIEYNFGEAERHGIFRTIPLGGYFDPYRLRLYNIRVTDDKGVDYITDITQSATQITIKIGDPYQKISGKNIYNISYKVANGLRFFAGHTELYWDVVGHQWSVPVRVSEAVVYVPNIDTLEAIDARCFRGVAGADDPCQSAVVSGQTVAPVISFADSELMPHQGMTIAVSVPDGMIAKPSLLDRIRDYAWAYKIILVPFVAFFILLYRWVYYGRDPKGRGTIVTEFAPPHDLQPAEVGAVIDERLQARDLSAEIIFLATRGYLKIIRAEKGSWWQKNGLYSLKRLDAPVDKLAPYQKKLLDHIFATGDEVILDALRENFSKFRSELSTEIFNQLTKNNYFTHNPDSVRTYYIIAGVIVIVFGFIALSSLFGIGLLVAGVLVLLFSQIMPARTAKGVQAREHILGFKRYLTVAEKDRLDFHHTPEKNPEHFDALLPYAMALGVERVWAEQFANIYQSPPTWYSDMGRTTFNTLLLTQGLADFQSQTNTLFSPSSSSSSGFSGGSSGGGSGGGGGGSW